MATKISNPFIYSEAPELNTIFDKLVALKDRVDLQMSKATAIGDIDASEGFKKLQPCKINLVNFRYRRNDNSWSKPKLETINTEVLASIKEAEAVISSVEDVNAPLVEYNNKICKKITELMIKIGIPSSYTTYEYASSRSRTRTSKSHAAGYIGDLTRATPVNEALTARYTLKTYIEDYEKWKKDEENDELKDKIDRDNQVFTRYVLENPVLVENLMKAGVNILSETRNATKGNKLDIVKYSIAQAISNLESHPDPDTGLIESLRDAI